MNRHSMVHEGKGSRGKRKVVKTSKKRSAVSRQLRAAKRQAMNILGGIGVIAVVVWIIQFITS